MFHIRKCKKKGAWAVNPLEERVLDLETIKGKFETIFTSPKVVLVKVEGYEVIVHKEGELLFKDCDEAKKIKKIAKEIYA